MLPYSCQTIEEDDIAAVVEALRSPLITQGPRVEVFERALAAYCGSRFAVAFSSGTAALHAACLVAGVEPGTQVVTSPLTFVASANCAFYCGAEPRFVDIDAETGNISSGALEAYMTGAEQRQERVAAVIPVHYGGYPCEMEDIWSIASAGGAAVVEDACHALGARWRDCGGQWHRVGDCSHSDMAVFSFHPVKGITTAEGGAVTTNEGNYYERLRRLREHGIVRAHEMSHAGHAGWYYEVRELGFNYRISDLQCALGYSQLRKVNRLLDRRARLARRYRELLGGIVGLALPPVRADRESANHLFAVRIDETVVGRDLVYAELALRGVGSQVHYIPVHIHPYYRGRLGYRWGDFPSAEKFYRQVLSLPLYPSLSNEEQARVCAALREVIEGEPHRARPRPDREANGPTVGGVA